MAQQLTTPGPSLARRGMTASFSCTVVSRRIVQSSLGMTSSGNESSRRRRVIAPEVVGARHTDIGFQRYADDPFKWLRVRLSSLTFAPATAAPWGSSTLPVRLTRSAPYNGTRLGPTQHHPVHNKQRTISATAAMWLSPIIFRSRIVARKRGSQARMQKILFVDDSSLVLDNTFLKFVLPKSKRLTSTRATRYDLG